MLLPPIIFSAGFNLNTEYFLKNIFYIVFFGVLSTLLTFLILVFITNKLTNFFNLPFTSLEISLLCTVLTSTDTISVLSLIKPETFPVLNAIVFGEGIVNDAVSILLFKIIN